VEISIEAKNFMSEDQFTKLYVYLQREFSDIGGDIADVKGMVRGLQGSVDTYAKEVLDIT